MNKMKKKLILLVSLVCCMFMAIPLNVMAREGARREKVRDRRVPKRVERQQSKKVERRTERHPDAAPIIEKRAERRGDKKVERRDKYTGEEGVQRREERRPQVKQAADLDKDGAISSEERSAYKERLQTTHEGIKEPRRDLVVEHTKEYKSLVDKYDSDGSGVLDRDEWKIAKPEFKSTLGENVAEDIELHNINKEKRQELLEPVE